MGLSPKSFQGRFAKELEQFERDIISRMNSMGLALLEEGYGKICARLEFQSDELVSELTGLFDEELGLQYEFTRAKLSVSNRSDFHINLHSSGSFFFDSSDLLQFAPRVWANKRLAKIITDDASRKLKANKNNIVSGYRYKMQESLRALCGEYSVLIEVLQGDFARIRQLLEGRLSESADERREAMQANRVALDRIRALRQS